jgi:hypothetical protein
MKLQNMHYYLRQMEAVGVGYSSNYNALVNKHRKYQVEAIRPALENLVVMWTTRLEIRVDIKEALVLSAMTSFGLPTIGDIIKRLDIINSSSLWGSLPWTARGGDARYAVLRDNVCDAFYDWANADDKRLGAISCPDVSDLPGLTEVTGVGYCMEDNTVWCDACNTHHTVYTDTNTVVVDSRWNQQEWCDDHNTFYCDVSDMRYCANTFNEDDTDDGNTICRQWARRNGWWWDDSRDVWCEHEPDGDDLPDYHDGDRSGMHHILHEMRQETTPPTKATRRFGLEVEVQFSDSGDRSAWYHSEAMYPHTAEKDGSLCDERGLEIISAPMTYEDWHNPDNSFLTLLASARANGAIGFAKRSGYGCHVNMDLRGVNERALHLYYAGVNNLSQLYIYVAGRSSSDLEYHQLRQPPQEMRLWQSFGHQKSVHYGDKYQPVRMDIGGSLPFCEVRAFGSNVRSGAVVEYIELCAATLDWAMETASKDEDTGPYEVPPQLTRTAHHSFMTYLQSQDGEYPQLKCLLERLGVTADNIPNYQRVKGAPQCV